MPNINDINGVTIANLSKLDGVTKANIAKVLGITLEAAAAFLLDTYTGAAAGYSVRRIASGATNLMRIREDSGDTETDIGYDSNGDLDTAAIATHCGTANGFVVSWVDQSGNGNDADQSTTTAQPKIYDGTTQAVITENGKSAMDCASSALVASSVTLDSYYSWYYVAKPDAAGGFIFEHSANSDPNNGGYNYLSLNNSAEIYRNPNAATQNATAGGGYAGTSQTLIDWNYSGTWTAYKDGAALSIINGTGNYGDIGDSSATDELNLFSRNESTLFFNGKFQEIIFWNNDQDAAGNRTGIEENINSDFLIYQPTDTPTSGLLATYSGAASAYSVRQLADTAVIAITVRRDSDDEEQRFGFDSNGDLDTTGIADFCTTANGYVSQWWDQSTNGNHATQSTAGNQPQIYNGTAVITENGKPAVDFTRTSSTVGHYLDIPSYQWQDSNGLMTIFGVWRTDGTINGQIWSDNTGGTTRSFQYTAGTYFAMTTITGSTPGSYDTSSNPTLVNDAQHLCTGIVTNGTVEQNVDGTQTDTVSTVVNARVGSFVARMGARPGASIEQPWDGRLQELIHYSSAQGSTNISGIETDINSEYLIYQPTDAPTSGLLATYTGAAAAYSVRQLSDKAIIALRIRRDSDDEEINIGWDSNGDLATADIAAFCGTANGYVTRWWDQSTNGNHADQATDASQPQIYNGTSVITENGKAALDFDGTNALNISVTGTVTNLTAFFVRGFATYPNTFQNGFHYKARGIGYNKGGGSGYKIAHLINGTASVQRADNYPTTTGQSLDYFLNQSELYRNSAAQTLQSGLGYTANTTSVIGGWKESSQNITATIQELIIYESDESSNRSGIESDIDTYFSIT